MFKKWIWVSFLSLLPFSPAKANFDFGNLLNLIITDMYVHGAGDESYAYSDIYDSGFRFWTKLENWPYAPYVVEVNRYAWLPPTPNQVEQAQRLYKQTLDSVVKNRWYIEQEALDAGYALEPEFDSSHYLNRVFLSDGEILNPDKPEYLMFRDTSFGKVLVGVMYQMEEQFATGPQVGGPLTVWHFHSMPFRCWEGVVYQRLKGTHCPDGTTRYYRSPEMIHVWFIPHPGGPFGSEMAVYIDDQIIKSLLKIYEEYSPRLHK